MKLLHVQCHSESWESLSTCRRRLHPEMLDLLVELGILEIKEDMIKSEELLRLDKIIRLKKVFGVNYTGAAIIVDLIAQIEDLQDEIERLQKGR